MSIKLSVSGIRPATEDYKRKLAAYVACAEAGIPLPRELINYFCNIKPAYVDPSRMVMSLSDHPCVKEHKLDDQDGVDIDLDQVPEGVKIIRVYKGY